MVYSLDINEILKKVMSSERGKQMEFETFLVKRNLLWSFKLKSKKGARAQGLSHIMTSNNHGTIILEDFLKLETQNSGFEPDLCSLKCCMFYDLGATVSGGVSNLGYSPERNGHLVHFGVSKDKAPKALHWYVDIACGVMGEFFRGYESVDLALSLARERGIAQFAGR